jgi:hypothetical protein
MKLTQQQIEGLEKIDQERRERCKRVLENWKRKIEEKKKPKK